MKRTGGEDGRGERGGEGGGGRGRETAGKKDETAVEVENKGPAKERPPRDKGTLVLGGP